MRQKESSISRYCLPIVTVGLYMFLYIPMIVLIIFSFNSKEYTYQWSSFSLKWYYELFDSIEIWDALKNSLIVATSSVILSSVMGVLLVFYSAHTYAKKTFLLFYGNLVVPEIVLAVGLLSFFAFFSIPLGITTLIAGHTLVGLGYVVPIVHARFLELDNRYKEASLDLGATENQTLMRVILPLLSPALFASGLLVFIISLDDFILSFFCAGATTQTLPIYIFSMMRSGATPVVSALSTLLIVISSILVLIFSSLQIKKTDMLQ